MLEYEGAVFTRKLNIHKNRNGAETPWCVAFPSTPVVHVAVPFRNKDILLCLLSMSLTRM